MDLTLILFYVFAAVMTAASVLVITARNPVHAALFLVLAFFNAAGIWMLLQAEFLAIALIVVYVGAVMVLFLFVVMMLDIDLVRIREGFWSYLPLGLAVAGVLVFEMILAVGGQSFANMPPGRGGGGQQHKSLAWLLFTDYMYPFEIASFVLLAAILAAVVLTLRHRPGNKAIDPAAQIAVKREDRLRIVAMPSEPHDVLPKN